VVNFDMQKGKNLRLWNSFTNRNARMSVNNNSTRLQVHYQSMDYLIKTPGNCCSHLSYLVSEPTKKAIKLTLHYLLI
jgi:hypothetical protein